MDYRVGCAAYIYVVTFQRAQIIPPLSLSSIFSFKSGNHPKPASHETAVLPPPTHFCPSIAKAKKETPKTHHPSPHTHTHTFSPRKTSFSTVKQKKITKIKWTIIFFRAVAQGTHLMRTGNQLIQKTIPKSINKIYVQSRQTESRTTRGHI